MKKAFPAAVLFAIALLPFALAADEKKMGTAAKPSDHAVFAPADISWVDGPPSLPPGAKLAVLEGDPTQEGIFTIRLKASDGYRIPPHWHPAFEHVTVMSGVFQIGMGDKFDETKLHAIPAGGFTYMAPGMKHFASVKGETIVQIHGMGPWQLYYVNAADDPRQMKK